MIIQKKNDVKSGSFGVSPWQKRPFSKYGKTLWRARRTSFPFINQFSPFAHKVRLHSLKIHNMPPIIVFDPCIFFQSYSKEDVEYACSATAAASCKRKLKRS